MTTRARVKTERGVVSTSLNSMYQLGLEHAIKVIREVREDQTIPSEK